MLPAGLGPGLRAAAELPWVLPGAARALCYKTTQLQSTLFHLYSNAPPPPPAKTSPKSDSDLQLCKELISFSKKRKDLEA